MFNCLQCGIKRKYRHGNGLQYINVTPKWVDSDIRKDLISREHLNWLGNSLSGSSSMERSLLPRHAIAWFTCKTTLVHKSSQLKAYTVWLLIWIGKLSSIGIHSSASIFLTKTTILRLLFSTGTFCYLVLHDSSEKNLQICDSRIF